MKILGIIPARGGSKGVPRKNIRLVDGKPLISYSINAGKESRLLTSLYVTTDDDEIIEIVKKEQCNYFKRVADNSRDNSQIEEVINELLDELNETYDLIVLLQPTAPIRTGEDIDNVIKMFIDDSSTESVVSVVELNDIHPARMYTIDNTSILHSLNTDNERKRRQDLNSVYIRNGCIYAVRTDVFLNENKIITSCKKAYLMAESKWANIDTERDLLITEVLIKEWKKGNL